MARRVLILLALSFFYGAATKAVPTSDQAGGTLANSDPTHLQLRYIKLGVESIHVRTSH